MFFLKMPQRFFGKAIGGFVATACFISGAASTFMMIPKKTQIIDLGMPEGAETAVVEDTYFAKFLSKVAPIASEEGAAEPFGLEATFDEFVVELPGHKIEVDGQIVASIKSLKDLDLTIDLDVKYNGKAVDLAIGYVDETLYLSTDELNLKTCFVNDEDANAEFIQFFRGIYSKFFDVENEDGLRIDLQLGDVLGSLIGDFDLSSLTSSLGGFSISEVEDEIYAYDTLNIALGESDLAITLTIEKETSSLEAVDLGTIAIGDCTIKGGLKSHSNPEIKVLPFDDANYTYKQRGDFIETFNYASWFDDIFNLLKNRRLGLDVYATITGADTSFAVVDADIDIDASRFEKLNITDLVVDSELFGLNKTEEDEESFIEKTEPTTDKVDIVSLLNNFDFNLGLKLSNTVMEGGESVLKDYSNLNLAYFKNSDEENAGYLSLNEEGDNAVMKAKIGVSTINYLVDQIPELVKTISDTPMQTETDKPGLFDFVTSSELVTAINEGKYEGIIDVIEGIKSTQNTIELTLNLSTLGFGEDSRVKLILEAATETTIPDHVVSIVASDVSIGSAVLNLEIGTREFNGTKIKQIDELRHTYDNLDFIEGTLDQVQNIANKDALGFEVTGSLLDENQLGFDFGGWAQLNYVDLQGFGSMTFNEYKYRAGEALTPHVIDISIDDFGADHSKNEMLFEYRDTLRGKFTLKTFEDIFDMVMRLTKIEDTRFTKFLGPIYEKITTSVIINAIKDQNYLALTQSSLIKNVSMTEDGNSIQIVLSKYMLMDLLPEDLTLKINFKKDSNGKKCVDSLEVSGMDVGGKTLEAKVTVKEYNDTKENPVDITKDFLDFSDIATLLEFGINTTELTYFHLSAKVNLTTALLGINLADIVLDFHITVKGDETKVYGKMATNPVPLKEGYSEIVFEPSGTDVDRIGGHFHIFRHDDRLFNLDKEYYYYASSEQFLDDALNFILSGFLGIDSGLLKSLDNLGLGEEKESDPQWEYTLEASDDFPAFQYETNDVDKFEWKARVNVEAIAGISTIGPAKATINGTIVDGKGYLSNIVAETTAASMPIKANITLVNPDPSVKDWPADIEARYQQIISIYNTLSDSQKASAQNAKSGAKVN